VSMVLNFHCNDPSKLSKVRPEFALDAWSEITTLPLFRSDPLDCLQALLMLGHERGREANFSTTVFCL
jgi:hypothetical protein